MNKYHYKIGYVDFSGNSPYMILCHEKAYGDDEFKKFIQYVTSNIINREFKDEEPTFVKLFEYLIEELIEKYGFTKLKPQAEYTEIIIK